MLLACGMSHTGGVASFNVLSSNTSNLYVPYFTTDGSDVKVNIFPILFYLYTHRFTVLHHSEIHFVVRIMHALLLQTFTGCSTSHEYQTYVFDPAVVAKQFCINMKTAVDSTFALKFELYGCTLDTGSADSGTADLVHNGNSSIDTAGLCLNAVMYCYVPFPMGVFPSGKFPTDYSQ